MTTLKLCALALATTAGFAEAQQAPTTMQKVTRNFGPTGLWSEFGQDTSYGTMQTRLAQSRSEIAAANADNDYAGYQDAANKISVPATVYFSLPDGHSAIRLKGTWTQTDSDENKTYADSEGLTGLAQYMYMVSPDTLLAFGALSGQVDVDIRHNGGTISSDSTGLRFDLLQNLGEHLGLAARAVYTWNDSTTKIPLGFTTLVTDQENEQLYLEGSLVHSAEHEQLGLIPEGWTLRSTLTGTYTHTTFETVTNSLGSVNDGTVGKHDIYATLAGRVRLLKPAVRPGSFGPYFELGYEREVVNDLDLVVDDPNILLTKIGAAKMFKNGLFLDVSYGRSDGFDGDRSVGSFTAVVSKAF